MKRIGMPGGMSDLGGSRCFAKRWRVDTKPRAYDRRVIAFFDHALLAK